MPVEITIESRQLTQLINAVRKSRRNLAREFAAAINATAKKSKGGISKQIRTELAATAAGVNRTIDVGDRANAGKLRTNVLLNETRKVSLKAYGARQTKRGVSYKISKTKGRRLAKSAFVSNRLGGHAYARIGKERLPIRKLMGPSPWGVFTKRNMTPEQEKQIRQELAKQVDRRIRLNILRAEGLAK